MKTVQQILEAKAHKVLFIEPDRSVFEALTLMAEKDVGALVVLDDGQLVGIVSERDYARKIILLGKSSRDTPVRDVMTTKVVCVGGLQTVDQCMALMTDKRIRHLPVLESNKVVGVISIGDVVKEVIADQQFQIHQLEQYIHS